MKTAFGRLAWVALGVAIAWGWAAVDAATHSQPPPQPAPLAVAVGPGGCPVDYVELAAPGCRVCVRAVVVAPVCRPDSTKYYGQPVGR